MGSYSETYEIHLPDLGSCVGGFDELHKHQLESWTRLPEVIRGTAIELEECRIELEFIWSEAIKVVQEKFRFEQEFWSDRRPEALDHYGDLSKQWSRTVIQCTAHFSPNTSKPLVAYYIQCELHNIFLAMNLSAPGSLNMAGVWFDYEERLKNLPARIDLNASPLEFACRHVQEGDWPRIRHIDLGQTWAWIDRLRLGSKQIADTRTERALFALLHLAQGGSVMVNNAIWIAHALESIFDSPPANIQTTLRERAFLLLGRPNDHRKAGKLINQFYEVRSAFVHGRMPVTHPMGNEVLDKRAEDDFIRMMHTTEFASGVLIAALQELITRGWVSAEFVEEVRECASA